MAGGNDRKDGVMDGLARAVVGWWPVRLVLASLVIGGFTVGVVSLAKGSWRGLVAGLLCIMLGLIGGYEMSWFRTTTIVSLVGACTWWNCGPSASSGKRLAEEDGLAASIIGVEDRGYVDEVEDREYAVLYERAFADEYVKEALGNFKAEGREKKVGWAVVYCRKKDTTSELERSNGNVEKKNYVRGMKFAICMGHVLPVVP